MIESILGIAKDELQKIDVPYEYMRWTSDINDRYWVGEYFETPTNTEDGYEEGTLILTGTTRGAWVILLDDRATIKDHFTNIYGLRTVTSDGAVVIFYEDSSPVPTGEADLKRMQINLKIKAWKGMK